MVKVYMGVPLLADTFIVRDAGVGIHVRFLRYRRLGPCIVEYVKDAQAVCRVPWCRAWRRGG